MRVDELIQLTLDAIDAGETGVHLRFQSCVTGVHPRFESCVTSVHLRLNVTVA